MKRKLITVLLINSIVLSGCGITNDQINISEWMFSDNLNPYECEKILGKAEEKNGKNATQYFWNDYKICNKYEGTLSLLYFNEEDPYSLNSDRNSYSFHWTVQCDYEVYKHIFKDLEDYNHLQKYITSASDGTNGECYNFITDFKDENYDEKWFFGDNATAYFVIYSMYEDGVLELQWGNGRVPIKE